MINKKLNNKSNKKLNNKTSKKTSKKLNNKSNKKLNNKTSKKVNNKSNKKMNKKMNKKINNKGGNNESINNNIVVTEVNLETVNITKEQFKKLLLINTFYEVYPNFVDIDKPSETPATQPRTKRERDSSNIVPNSNILKRLKTQKQQGGNSDDIFLLLSYLDNVHDFAGNNRCKIDKIPKFFKDYIKYLYENLGLEQSLINEYDHKEGIILYKMLEKNPGKYQKMVFKMNKNYAKNLPILSRNIGEKNEYIVQILDDKTIPKEAGQCILYDSPVYRLNDYDLVNEKNHIFTSMEIKNDSIITTPPEKLFDSGTGYKNGICIKTQPTNALPTSSPNISLDYNTYPLFNILKLQTSIPYKIEFKKELDKLCYMENCEIYNSNSGYSVRQLKEWIVENIGYFKSNSTTVTNPLINREHMINLNIFINELLRKLINISKFGELNIRNQDLLKFYIAMSIKRLGDWGMVNRNIDDGNIFITNDTLCALYAILKDSKLIFHVPSTYSKKLKGHGFMKNISGKNMGLIGFYNLKKDETIEPIEPNPELDEFIKTETNIIKNTIVKIGGEEISKDMKFISQNL